MKLEGLEIKIDFIASPEMEKALGRFAASAESFGSIFTAGGEHFV